MPQSKYDSYGGSSTNNDEYELTFTPEASLISTYERAFGTSSQFGQSFGVVRSNIEITDGALYYDADKDKYKLFSVEQSAGISPVEALDRGQELDVDDADDFLNKTYGSTSKTYDLVAARFEEVRDDDGEVLIEATSKSRTFERDGDSLDFSEWEYHDGEPVPIEWDALTWYSGSDEYGPSTASQNVAETLSTYGDDIVVDEDDVYNWLTDTSGNDILRDDVRGREIEFFMTISENEDGFNYYVPHFVDVETGAEIVPNNASSNSDDGSDADDSGSGGGAGGSALSRSNDTVPEAVADFINTAQSLELNEGRAENLLNDTIEDTETALTGDMVEEAGGRDAVIEQVV